jgi:hypothetical protein
VFTWSRRFLVASLVSLGLLACSSSSTSGTTSGAGGADDGKLHPPGNGVAMSETDACNAVSNALDSDYLALGCVATSQSCPDLLRAQFGADCLQYDQGSVQGCVSYYGMAASCAALDTAASNCVVTALAGSAPKGCP